MAEHSAKDVNVGDDPEFDLTARLPEQVAAGANHQDANNTQKFWQDYPPRPAVRLSTGRVSGTSRDTLGGTEGERNSAGRAPWPCEGI